MEGQKTFIFIAEVPLILSKDNANRVENKINLFIFYPEVPLILSKDNAKIRLSERNGNLFTFPSVRILSKPSGEYD